MNQIVKPTEGSTRVYRNLLDYLIRPIELEDEPFLWEMLYQAIYVPAGAVAPPREIVKRPELSCYVEGWGRSHDYGIKALTRDVLQPVGAVWLRLLSAGNSGYGYVDELTPELSVAVKPEYRGRGIGTVLLKEMLKWGSDRYEALSLSVSAENPAVRMYEREGFQVVGEAGESLIMKIELKTRE